MKKFTSVVLGVLLIGSSTNAVAAETLSITESSDYTAVVEVVGQIWKGKIPTRIAYPAGSSSQKLEFQIQGILPQSVLGNRATGTDVEFEIWSDAGKKNAYEPAQVDLTSASDFTNNNRLQVLAESAKEIKEGTNYANYNI